jgi:AraC family transcriptional regulator of arabinose operon
MERVMAKSIANRSRDRRVRAIIREVSELVSFEREVIEALAMKVNLSPSRLRHLFRREIGMSIGQFVRRQRLERARGLLESTFLNIKEVASSVGVSDQSHFVKDFKRAYGMTPSQYRIWRSGSR